MENLAKALLKSQNELMKVLLNNNIITTIEFIQINKPIDDFIECELSKPLLKNSENKKAG